MSFSYYEKIPEGWAVCCLEEVIDYEQPANYLVSSSDYHPSFKTPVLTAGKSFILGYTNESEGIFENVPVIIFDDFTTESKYVDFPFKAKSSAMKILKPNNALVLTKYAYFLMQTLEIDHDNHQRYWISTVSKKQILLPPLAEQKKIIERIETCFAFLDNIA